MLSSRSSLKWLVTHQVMTMRMMGSSKRKIQKINQPMTNQRKSNQRKQSSKLWRNLFNSTRIMKKKESNSLTTKSSLITTSNASSLPKSKWNILNKRKLKNWIPWIELLAPKIQKLSPKMKTRRNNKTRRLKMMMRMKRKLKEVFLLLISRDWKDSKIDNGFKSYHLPTLKLRMSFSYSPVKIDRTS